MLRYLLAAAKFFGFFLQVCWIIPLQSLVLLLHTGKFSYVLPRLWQRAVCFIFGLSIKIEGTPNLNAQTIFMSNHISYLDIPLLGSILPASFVAKQEVAGWPLFGYLATLQQTAFLERKKSKIGAAKNGLQAMLASGKSLIIFPEGTSTDGRDVRPFKTSLFELAMDRNLHGIYIQPVTIRVETTDGKPITDQDSRDLYSWHIDMDTELHPHLWRFAQTSGSKVTVIFHRPLLASDFADRKMIAAATYDAVKSGLHATQLA